MVTPCFSTSRAALQGVNARRDDRRGVSIGERIRAIPWTPHRGYSARIADPSSVVTQKRVKRKMRRPTSRAALRPP